jgi:hypothetical protein
MISKDILKKKTRARAHPHAHTHTHTHKKQIFKALHAMNTRQQYASSTESWVPIPTQTTSQKRLPQITAMAERKAACWRSHKRETVQDSHTPTHRKINKPTSDTQKPDKHKQKQKNKQTPWSESASELYRQSDRRLSAKWLPTFADKECHVVSLTDPYGRTLGLLDRSRYFSIK